MRCPRCRYVESDSATECHACGARFGTVEPNPSTPIPTPDQRVRAAAFTGLMALSAIAIFISCCVVWAFMVSLAASLPGALPMGVRVRLVTWAGIAVFSVGFIYAWRTGPWSKTFLFAFAPVTLPLVLLVLVFWIDRFLR